MVANGTDGHGVGCGALGGGDCLTVSLAGPDHGIDDLTCVHFEVAAGPNAGASFDATAERIVIGTHESATVRLDDRTVSRFHCEVTHVGGQLLVRDLGSRNGTYIDGVAIREAFCPPTGALVLGETRLALRSTSRCEPASTATRDRFGLLIGRSAAM